MTRNRVAVCHERAVCSGFPFGLASNVLRNAIVPVAVFMASCTGNPQLLTEDGSVSSEARDALIAPVVSGSDSNHLNNRDLMAAYNALVETLGQSAPYTSVSWQSGQSRNFGEITPGPRYFVNDSFCLYYTHRYTLNGLQFVRNGTACTDAGGNWQSLE